MRKVAIFAQNVVKLFNYPFGIVVARDTTDR
jgi:hypothetical protein